jgi:hypothetical protein
MTESRQSPTTWRLSPFSHHQSSRTSHVERTNRPRAVSSNRVSELGHWLVTVPMRASLIILNLLCLEGHLPGPSNKQTVLQSKSDGKRKSVVARNSGRVQRATNLKSRQCSNKLPDFLAKVEIFSNIATLSAFVPRASNHLAHARCWVSKIQQQPLHRGQASSGAGQLSSGPNRG